MEEFDDDDFSDLYADVEVQASSAISALHRATELLPRSDRISANAAQEEKKTAERDASREEEEGKGGGGGSGLRNVSVENGDRRESRSASWSESESEDDLASSGDDGVEKKVDDRASDVRFGEISGKEKRVNGGDSSSERKMQYSSLNSKLKRGHERAQQVHKTCRKGDADDRSGDSPANYELLSRYEQPNNRSLFERQIFSLVWKALAPRKAMSMSWRLLLDRLPTIDNLDKRGVINGGGINCSCCGVTPESANHLFVGCEPISKLWSSMVQKVGVVWTAPTTIREHFWQFSHLGNIKKVRKKLGGLWMCVVWVV